jgi:hypothetical protein
MKLKNVLLVMIMGLGLSMCSGPEEKFSPFFNTNFKPMSARIIPESELNEVPTDFALARLENKRLSLMVRDDSGQINPFFVRGIETGFWDTRRGETDWDQVFENYRKLGSNTALFMLHWNDIEPEDGRFDFSFADMIVEKAEMKGIKIWWVLFLHTQPNLLDVDEDTWFYTLSGSDEADSVMQWVKNEEGKLMKTTAEQFEHIDKQFHAYGHPEIFTRTINMIQTLAEHYKNSGTVIGVQIGNEEGFNFRGPSDYNPYTLKLYDKWSLETGRIDTVQFKKEIFRWWWQQYTTAFHEIDPYKLTSFNLQAGGPEAGNLDLINSNGSDCSIYREGNIDVIGTMFYDARGETIWKNFDMEYSSFVYDLPILIPSEIGIGWRNAPYSWGQVNVLQMLERGGLGFACYCYGELVDRDGNINDNGIYYRNLVANIEANEDILCTAIPGSGDLVFESDMPGLRISQLKGTEGKSLGILYFPETCLEDNADENNEKIDLQISIETSVTGNYNINIYHEGVSVESMMYEMKANEIDKVHLTGIKKTVAVFIAARPVR